MLEKQRENNAAYVEFLEEKRLIDEVIAKVKAEQRAARLEVVARYVNGHVYSHHIGMKSSSAAKD